MMIYNENLRLRPPERADIPRFVAWLNDPEVRANLSLYLPLSTPEEEEWFDQMLKSPKEARPLVIELMEDPETWTAIGSCGISGIDWKNRSGEIGIFIGEKQLWNRGYGTRVMGMLLRHGFNTLNLNRLSLRVFETNLGGIRAYEKAGFVHEGRSRQAEFRDGKYIDVLNMSVLKCDWAERK
jgi:RimJ/RimL family protein N-acetyltransferase